MTSHYNRDPLNLTLYILTTSSHKPVECHVMPVTWYHSLNCRTDFFNSTNLSLKCYRHSSSGTEHPRILPNLTT